MSAFTSKHSLFFPKPYGSSWWLRFQINCLGLWAESAFSAVWQEELDKLKLMPNAEVRQYIWEEMQDWHFFLGLKRRNKEGQTSSQDASRLIEATWLNWLMNLKPLNLVTVSLTLLPGHLQRGFPAPTGFIKAFLTIPIQWNQRKFLKFSLKWGLY